MPYPCSPSSSSLLIDVDMNIYDNDEVSPRFPPGLGLSGLGNLPDACASSPSLLLPHKSPTRRRSGSFTFVSGSTYATGDLFHGNMGTLTSSFSPISSLSTRKRAALEPGFNLHCGAFGSTPAAKRNYPPSTPVTKTKFDPFGADDVPIPLASSTSYSHYWEYDPSINGPKLCSRPTSPSLSNITIPPTPRLHHIDLPSISPSKRANTFPHSIPTTTSSSLKTISLNALPFPPPMPDKNARSKLVAGILLNRIHTVGKPGKRRSVCLAGADRPPKQYVKSNLSTVTNIEC